MNFHSKSSQNIVNTSVFCTWVLWIPGEKQIFGVDVVMRLTKHCKYQRFEWEGSCKLLVLQLCPACSLVDWQCLKIWFMWVCSRSEMVPGSVRSAIMPSLCFYGVFVWLLHILPYFLWHPFQYKLKEWRLCTNHFLILKICCLIFICGCFFTMCLLDLHIYIYNVFSWRYADTILLFVDIDRENLLGQLHSSILLSASSNHKLVT